MQLESPVQLPYYYRFSDIHLANLLYYIATSNPYNKGHSHFIWYSNCKLAFIDYPGLYPEGQQSDGAADHGVKIYFSSTLPLPIHRRRQQYSHAIYLCLQAARHMYHHRYQEIQHPRDVGAPDSFHYITTKRPHLPKHHS